MRQIFFSDGANEFPKWEEKKLGDVALIKMGQSPDGKSYTDDPNETVLIQGNADMKNGQVVPRIYTSEGTKFCKPNDIIMSVRAPVGALAKTDIEACIGRGVCSITANDYIYHYLGYLDATRGWDKISQGSTFEAISSKDVSNLIIPFPSLPEQQKIAEFFSALDERIALTADKAKLLKEQKQGYLQKVFSRELVFADDNGDTYVDWKQKRLGDVAKMVSGFSFKETDYQENGHYRVITNANVQSDRYLDLRATSTINDLPEKLKSYQLLRKHNILITLDGNVGRAALVPDGKFVLAQRVGLLQVNEQQVNSLFLYSAIAHPAFKAEMESKMQGGGLKHIYARDVEGYQIVLPSLPEQQKIAEFFSALDDQIELTENKLSLLKEQKKGYLQGIFG